MRWVKYWYGGSLNFIFIAFIILFLFKAGIKSGFYTIISSKVEVFLGYWDSCTQFLFSPIT